MPSMPPNQQRQSTEGNADRMHRYLLVYLFISLLAREQANIKTRRTNSNRTADIALTTFQRERSTANVGDIGIFKKHTVG